MIHNIETLPIITFAKIAETNNLNLLLKWKPKYLLNLYLWLFKIDLFDSWSKLGEEYAKHQDDKKQDKIKILKSKLSKQKGRYYAIISALEVLKYGSDDDMLKILKDYGYTIKGQYWKGLEQVFKQVSNLSNKIKSIEEEIIKYSQSNENIEINIYEIITNLSLGLEIPLKANELTTIEYIFYRKALAKKIKQQNKK